MPPVVEDSPAVEQVEMEAAVPVAASRSGVDWLALEVEPEEQVPPSPPGADVTPGAGAAEAGEFPGVPEEVRAEAAASPESPEALPAEAEESPEDADAPETGSVTPDPVDARVAAATEFNLPEVGVAPSVHGFEAGEEIDVAFAGGRTDLFAFPEDQPARFPLEPSPPPGGLILEAAIGSEREQFQVAGERATVGRLDVAGGLIPDVALRSDDAVSRRHAELRRRAGGWMIVDVGSTNGTRLNGSWLQPHQEAPLRDGDEIGLGAVTTLTVRLVDEPEGGE
jgi:hypothetical protein